MSQTSSYLNNKKEEIYTQFLVKTKKIQSNRPNLHKEFRQIWVPSKTTSPLREVQASDNIIERVNVVNIGKMSDKKRSLTISSDEENEEPLKKKQSKESSLKPVLKKLTQHEIDKLLESSLKDEEDIDSDNDKINSSSDSDSDINTIKGVKSKRQIHKSILNENSSEDSDKCLHILKQKPKIKRKITDSDSNLDDSDEDKTKYKKKGSNIVSDENSSEDTDDQCLNPLKSKPKIKDSVNDPVASKNVKMTDSSMDKLKLKVNKQPVSDESSSEDSDDQCLSSLIHKPKLKDTNNNGKISKSSADEVKSKVRKNKPLSDQNSSEDSDDQCLISLKNKSSVQNINGKEETSINKKEENAEKCTDEKTKTEQKSVNKNSSDDEVDILGQEESTSNEIESRETCDSKMRDLNETSGLEIKEANPRMKTKSKKLSKSFEVLSMSDDSSDNDDTLESKIVRKNYPRNDLNSKNKLISGSSDEDSDQPVKNVKNRSKTTLECEIKPKYSSGESDTHTSNKVSSRDSSPSYESDKLSSRDSSPSRMANKIVNRDASPSKKSSKTSSSDSSSEESKNASVKATSRKKNSDSSDDSDELLSNLKGSKRKPKENIKKDSQVSSESSSSSLSSDEGITKKRKPPRLRKSLPKAKNQPSKSEKKTEDRLSKSSLGSVQTVKKESGKSFDSKKKKIISLDSENDLKDIKKKKVEENSSDASLSSDEGESERKGKNSSSRNKLSSKEGKSSAKGDPLMRHKKYLRTMGIRINNYGKFFEGYKSLKSRKEKIIKLMEENGLKGKPTLEKCKKIRNKIERKKEIEELSLENIITDSGRGKRNVKSLYSRSSSDVLNQFASPIKKSRIKRLPSESESD